MSANIKFSLSDEDLTNVTGGADIAATLKDITITLEEGEDAAAALASASFPLGLKLDAESSALVNDTIAPTMGTTGPRNLYATFSIKYPYVHVESYTLS